MNGPFQTAQQLTPTAPPAEFEVLAPPPLLLPGETLAHYQALRQAIFADIAPRSAIEWLLAVDIAELSYRPAQTLESSSGSRKAASLVCYLIPAGRRMSPSRAISTAAIRSSAPRPSVRRRRRPRQVRSRCRAPVRRASESMRHHT